MSEADEPVTFRYLFLVRDADRDLCPGVDEYGPVYSVDGDDELLPDGMDTVARYEFPLPTLKPEVTRWLAESEAALEWLTDALGRGTAEQLREEALNDPNYPEKDSWVNDDG